MIHRRTVPFPFHTERSRAKIQPAVASDSPGEFRRQPALNDNPDWGGLEVILHCCVATVNH